MEISLKPGKYIVATSGGIDSMVLLDLLSKIPELELVVAHFNHGIRDDSVLDEHLVTAAAKSYGLPFTVGRGNLGPGASEDLARRARYAFLNQAKEDFEASAIVTAHHQDDLIETALLNILRGSGRRGLTAIKQNPLVLRPLIDIPKAQILRYAKTNRLAWRDDPTNKDTTYLRNYLRQKLTDRLSPRQRQSLLQDLEKLSQASVVMDKLIAKLSAQILKGGKIDRVKFVSLPVEIGDELVHHWLNELKVKDIDKKTVRRLSLALKTAKPGTSHRVRSGLSLVMDSQSAHFRTDSKHD